MQQNVDWPQQQLFTRMASSTTAGSYMDVDAMPFKRKGKKYTILEAGVRNMLTIIVSAGGSAADEGTSIRISSS